MHGFADRVRARRAGGAGGPARAPKAEARADVAGGEVRQNLQNGERAQAARAALRQALGCGLKAGEPPDAGTDDHADAIGVDLGSQVSPQVGVVDRHLRRREGQQLVAIHALLFAAIHPVGGLEAVGLARDARIEARGIEQGDGTDARTAGDQRLPGGVGANATGRDQPQAGNHHALSVAQGFSHRSNTSRVDVAEAYRRPLASFKVASLNAARRPKDSVMPSASRRPVSRVMALW